MATYSFRIKKGNFQLELSTSDKDLLVEQFALWVKDASIYAKKRKVKECKDIVNTQIKAEEEITKKNIETQLAKQPKVEIPSLDTTPISNPKLSNENPTEENLDIVPWQQCRYFFKLVCISIYFQ